MNDQSLCAELPARPFRSGAIVAVLAEARTLLSAEFPKFVALWHGW